MTPCYKSVVLVVLLLPLARAADAGIPAEELARAPAPARIATLVQGAASQGWGSAVPDLRAAALAAYETGSGYATAWYYLYRWADLLGTPYNQAIGKWIGAVEAAKVGHPNMASRYESRPGSLAAFLSPPLQLALLGNAAFSEEFFTLQSPVDNPAQVLAILQQIYAAEPALFADYQSLALAIAVVYDVPPPPHWPHGQVGAKLLPRTLPPPAPTFAYWAKLDRANFALHRLRRLPASELKFLVDAVTPFSELDWARRNVPPGLTDLAKAYDLVKYRKDRVTLNQFSWPGTDYRLASILQQGGICVDQAYFASMTGKAKGIPTILFRGAGLDGRHAWFGYLDTGERWHLDCGRFADQKFVVGLAFDPQTWGDLNDHELLFITERFRALPTYRLSVMHVNFAAEYLRDQAPDRALKAAREAVNREPRNLDAWQTLLRAQQAAAPADLRAQEAVLREAARAFQKYPDLENYFTRRLVEVLRARGETSLASFETQRLARKYQTGRVDLSIQSAGDALERSMRQDDLATQIRIYQKLLDTSGRGAAIDFYDKVVAPFVQHLADEGQIPAALQALDRARHTLRVEPGKQLDLEMKELADRLRAGRK
ncbi:MAG: hypothetical protein HYV75_01275 [Opitutae bacterium]|nr:hypothetical protein [Opitutae bacterium]